MKPTRWASTCQQAGAEAVPLRRDGEVPARHVLLQRLPRAAVPRRGPADRAQSPKDVSTYDQKPEMAARGVCRREWSSGSTQRPVRPGRGQLRQHRHGRPHRRARRRPSRPSSTSIARVGESPGRGATPERGRDRPGRPRQLPSRWSTPSTGTPQHVAHDVRRGDHRRRRPVQGAHAAFGWKARRHRADRAADDGVGSAEGNDRRVVIEVTPANLSIVKNARLSC